MPTKIEAELAEPPAIPLAKGIFLSISILTPFIILYRLRIFSADL
ncbi:hypothetical protein ES705_38605 [subsurface metagenome]